jgi:perosamine synthetase
MINFFNTHISADAMTRVASVLNSTFLSEGKLVAEFEEMLSRQLGIENPVAVNSGTSALHLAVLLAGVGPGDEVILPAQTFIASGLAIKYVGATPVFADINYETGNIKPQAIEAKLTEKTKAIMVVHWGGLPCDMQEILAIASKNGLPVIEDAAHALGATYQGKRIGTISDFTCFSFQAIKHVTTGDGGAIASRKKALSERALGLRWFGINRKSSPLSDLGERSYNADEIGYKYHLSDYGAALGMANLDGFASRLARSRAVTREYREQFAGISGLKLWTSPRDRESSCWLFGMHVEKRPQFIKAMHANGIPASVVHQRIDRNSILGGTRDDLPNQARFDESQIHIPVHSALTDEEVSRIIAAVKAGW